MQGGSPAGLAILPAGLARAMSCLGHELLAYSHHQAWQNVAAVKGVKELTHLYMSCGTRVVYTYLAGAASWQSCSCVSRAGQAPDVSWGCGPASGAVMERQTESKGWRCMHAVCRSPQQSRCRATVA